MNQPVPSFDKAALRITQGRCWFCGQSRPQKLSGGAPQRCRRCHRYQESVWALENERKKHRAAAHLAARAEDRRKVNEKWIFDALNGYAA